MWLWTVECASTDVFFGCGELNVRAQKCAEFNNHRIVDLVLY